MTDILVEQGLFRDKAVYSSTGNPYNYTDAPKVTPCAALITGFILGTIETLFLKNIFKKRSFAYYSEIFDYFQINII